MKKQKRKQQENQTEIDTFDILQNNGPLSNDDSFFNVEAILDKQNFGKTLKYLVKWEGYSDSENTWEPLKNLLVVKDMVDQFNKNFDEAKKKKTEKQQKQKSVEKQQKQKSIEKSKNKQKIIKKLPLKKNTTKIQEKQRSRSISRQKETQELDNSFQQKIVKSSKSSIEKMSNHIVSNNSFQKQQEDEQKKKISQEENSTNNTNINIANEPDYQILIKQNGDFETGDKAVLIHRAKIDENKQLLCDVEWEFRKDGTKPLNSWISTIILRQKEPQLLLDYYEKRVNYTQSHTKVKLMNYQKMN